MTAPQQRAGLIQVSPSLKSAREHVLSKGGFLVASYDGPRSLTLSHRGDEAKDVHRRVHADQINWVLMRVEQQAGAPRRIFVGYFGPRYNGPIPLGHMPYVYKAMGPADLVFTTHNEADLSPDTILALLQSDPNDWAPPALLVPPSSSLAEQELQF